MTPPRETVQRFTQWCAISHKHMLSSEPDGAWVRYEDHERLLATEIAQREAAERELAEWRAVLDELHVVNWTNLDADKLSPRDAVRTLLEKALDQDRDELRAALTEALRERDEARALHQELVFQVGSKFPGETRHETAKRYIRTHEDCCGPGGPYSARALGRDTETPR